MLSQGTVPLACRQGGLCPEHTGPVRLDGAYLHIGMCAKSRDIKRTAGCACMRSPDHANCLPNIVPKIAIRSNRVA
jgi:hypothetical protein